MDLKLKDKVALVTGGAKGIGEGIARAFLAEGARVAVTGREAPDRTAFEEREGEESRFRFFRVEMTDANQVKDCVEEVIRSFGRLDIVVNNAGVNDAVGLRKSVEAFRLSLERNLVHYFSATRCALDELIENEGAIVNIGSKTALTGQGGTSGYAASNGAIHALTREWAADLASQGVRVNCVIPAEVITPQYEKWLEAAEDPEQALARLNASIPFRRRATTIEEVAATVVFLASPRSSHTTGQLVFVDGGYVHLDRALTSGVSHLKKSVLPPVADGSVGG